MSNSTTPAGAPDGHSANQPLIAFSGAASKASAAFRSACEAEGFAIVPLGHNPQGRRGPDIVAVELPGETLPVAAGGGTAGTAAHVPVLAIVDAMTPIAPAAMRDAGIAGLLCHPFTPVEAAARLRTVSRLRMLRDEVASRGGVPMRSARQRRIACVEAGGTAIAEPDGTSLLRLALSAGAIVSVANAGVDAVLLDATMGRAECAAFIARMRAIAALRTTPAIIVNLSKAEAANAAWLDIGAHDLIADASPAGLVAFQIGAACERRDLVEALKRLAREDAARLSATDDAIDSVTGLAGRGGLARAIERSARRLVQQGKPLSLLVISADPHPDLAPGAVLPETVAGAVADVLRRSLRGFDVACRIGPDCFAILMPGVAADGAAQAAARLCSAIAAERIRVGRDRHSGLTCSIGIADALTVEEAAALASAAMDALADARAVEAAPGLVARAA